MYKKIISIAFIIVIAVSVFCGCSGKITPSPNNTPNSIIASPSPIIPTPSISPDVTILPTLSPDISPNISPEVQGTPSV